ncbi:hypothetical protein [Microbacterium sp. BK668]|uniref:hypothetical protein n=1 Tax=Microbacterium sp. BK668 TaxID=2512118 RepID=UPI0010602CC2|nr:hypothetical protein [Microbacterium sp. BK668]TDN90851.1 hypothetical protein EV279_0344 [Microbacterium sp. BK668]
MKYKHVRASSLAAVAVVVGLLSAVGATGAASAADETISGEGRVTLDFSVTPGSVSVEVWTHSLSTVPAYGAAIVQDVDGQRYSYGPELYQPDEEKTYYRVLAGRTCADLGGGAIAFAFGFGSLEATAPDWIGEPLSYPDPRITVVGCDAPPPPPPVDPVTPPVVVTPTDGGTTAPVPGTTQPVATNKLPAAKTDGAELAGSSPSPLLGFAVTIGAILAAAIGGRVTGSLTRR